MLLGLTHGELGFVVFVFVLVYAAQLLPRAAERAGAWLSRKR